MTDIRSEHLQAFVSAKISSLDGIQHTTLLPVVSAFLGTWADALFKMNNRINSPSTALISGGTADDVALSLPSSIGASAIYGVYQGVPFTVDDIGIISGTPGSGLNTTSNTAKKVLCVLSFEDLPVASSLGAPTFGFVYGSAFETGVDFASTGDETEIYNAIPVPKAESKQVPVGILHIPNSFASGDGITVAMLHTDYRQMQGYDFDLIFADLVQP